MIVKSTLQDWSFRRIGMRTGRYSRYPSAFRHRDVSRCPVVLPVRGTTASGAMKTRLPIHTRKTRTVGPLRSADGIETHRGTIMHQIIYIVGAIVIVLAILSFIGLN